jgi:hypothetical protein
VVTVADFSFYMNMTGYELNEIIKDFPPLLISYNIYITRYIMLQNLISQHESAK